MATDHESRTYTRIANLLERIAKISSEKRLLLKLSLRQDEKQLASSVSTKDWFYEVEWRHQARVEKPQFLSTHQPTQHLLQKSDFQSASTTSDPLDIKTSEPRSWLVFADSQGIAQQFATRLRARGEVCTLVFPGEKYEQLAEQEFQVEPSNPADFQLLVEDLGKSQPSLYGVVHLWSLDAVEADSLVVDDLDVILQKGCGSTLRLIQALEKRLSQLPLLWLVTRGVQPVGKGYSIPGLAQSPLWGMGKAITLEHPELKCVQVDLNQDERGDEAQILLEEISSNTLEDQVAFRDQVRYVARLVPCTQKQDSVFKDEPRFHENGTYLVTGGLGGLGLLVTRWMVERGARHIVLVGRNPATPSVSHQLQEMEQAGAELVVIQADVTQEKQIAQVLTQIEHSLPQLRGIIHAAGLLDDALLLQVSWEKFSKVMAPKIKGAWNLHNMTRGISLDFFVMFSSAASLLGSPGQANYAAANAFLDALSYLRQSQGLPGLSINWGAWSEVGIAAKHQADERIKAKGIRTIHPEQGLQVLKLLFSQNFIQVGVIPINWSQFLKERITSSFFADFASAAEQPLKLQPDFLYQLENASVYERRELLVNHVCFHAAKILGLNGSDLMKFQKGFFDLGMDSLMSLELRNRLQSSLGYPIPSTLAFDYPTVEALADYLAREVLNLEFSDVVGEELQNGDDQFASEMSLGELSENELEKLLDEKLASINEL